MYLRKNENIEVLCLVCVLTHLVKLMMQWPFPNLVPFLSGSLAPYAYTESEASAVSRGFQSHISFLSPEKACEERRDFSRALKYFLLSSI